MPGLVKSGARLRGRPPRLSRETIVEVAERIVADEGFDALTIARVARELGASPMSLYRHFKNKDALLIALLDGLYRQGTPPLLGGEPRKYLVALWRYWHDALAKCPWIVEALIRSDVIAPSVVKQIDEAVAAFIACGASPEDAVAGYRILWQYTIGELMMRGPLLERMRAGAPSPIVEMLRSVDAARFPALAKAAPLFVSTRGQDVYAESVERIIEGILAHSARRR